MKLFTVDATGALASIAVASMRSESALRLALKERIRYIYGDMTGQRAVEVPELAVKVSRLLRQHVDIADLVVALEHYFVVVCKVIALSAWRYKPSDFIEGVGRLTPAEFRTFLADLETGAPFKEHGLEGFGYCIDLAWIANTLSDSEIIRLRDCVGHLSNIWQGGELRIPGDDPFQVIHHLLFPRNLRHISGQFYTPEWLADQLIADSGWSPDNTLMDPFCGSGVFLVRAFRRAVSMGVSPAAALESLLGFDLNPMACIAARCNLAMAISRLRPKMDSDYRVNIVATDSLRPAVIAGQSDLFTLALNLPAQESALHKYGLDLRAWSVKPSKLPTEERTCSLEDRAKLELELPGIIGASDVVLTNPPWVGWEYIAKPYRDYLMPGWRAYDLFKSKGLEAAFLKEDMSTLALMTAWDKYLKCQGVSSVVLRPATMFSHLAARGVRRLSIGDHGTKLNLKKVRIFHNLKVFGDAATDTATWLVEKGKETSFPVPVVEWVKSKKGWNPSSATALTEVRANCQEVLKIATPTVPSDNSSRWLVDSSAHIDAARGLQGENPYSPRMGVFTGGANAVFYLDILRKGEQTSKFRNIVERAKRQAPEVNVTLENDVVFEVLRGRDIAMWSARPEVYLLCCHTKETKISPLPEKALQEQFPLTHKYLSSMRDILEARQGFSGWEKDVLRKYFYTLQRVGDYTFAPFKVCWKYIAMEFTVCVVGPDETGKPVLPNDKVMFVPFDNEEEAFFLCGLLSGTAVSKYVNASTSKRQISVSAIKSIELPLFNGQIAAHREISALCKEGHLRLRNDPDSLIDDLQNELDALVTHCLKN